MPKFGPQSIYNLEECHPELQRLFNEVIKHYDCSIICGHRNQFDQNAAYVAGKSNAQWGESKHNTLPSLAVDAVPYPLDWDDTEEFKKFAALVLFIAANLNIEVTWGGDFKNLVDMPHFELVL